MITLQEIFDDLAAGPLANLALVNNTTQAIQEKDYNKVLSFVNLSLTSLHKRFTLRTGQVVVQQHPDLMHYPLRSKFAESNVASTEAIKFIKDTIADPFWDDIIKIEQVFSELGEEYIINDSAQEYPVYTPEFDVISMVPTGEIPQAVVAIYRAKYPKIVLTSTALDPTLIEVNIPDWILEALYARVAAYAYKGIMGDEGETSASRNYMFQYELECKRIETEGTVANDNDTSTSFEDKGWA